MWSICVVLENHVIQDMVFLGKSFQFLGHPLLSYASLGTNGENKDGYEQGQSYENDCF